MPFDKSLNDVNQALFAKLKDMGVLINFKVETAQTSWAVRQNYCYTIVSPNETPNAAAMAHELLHIELDMKGFSSSHRVYMYFNERSSVFTLEFIPGLDNTLAHFKMLDNFIKMGYTVDEFLQDTPKTYFLEAMIFRTIGLVVNHKAGIANICEQTRDIIGMTAAAKLFEQYKAKDPNTQNGLHPDLVLNPLREINKELVDELALLLEEWNSADTADNLHFYSKVDTLLKRLGIPNAVDCEPI